MAHLLDATTHGLERIKQRAHEAAADVKETIAQRHALVDVSVKFIGANDLPKMDAIGTADPYFVATIDDKVKYTSTVQVNTLKPVWNEEWRIRNVPDDGKLKIVVHDKDDGSPLDDQIGVCETDLQEGARELEIKGGRLGVRTRGTFWLQILSVKPATAVHLLPYTFDGPIYYSRHFSPTVGLLTNIDETGRRLYSTWKMRIRGVTSYLSGPPQHWNTKYAAAQRIFGPGGSSYGVRLTIQNGHRLLYARSTTNGFGELKDAKDLFALLRGGRVAPERIKPAVYTYVIASEDDTWRFSETGAAFFVDFASKHALHANCSETVRYSGEFHPRPEGGWENFDDSKQDSDVNWELVIDNNSGTYAPDKTLLPKLSQLLEYNFPGARVIALDREDHELERSREACREYALKNRQVKPTELQPNKQQAGEDSLCQRVTSGWSFFQKKQRPMSTPEVEHAIPGPANEPS